MYACVHVHVCACVQVCVCACACVCLGGGNTTSDKLPPQPTNPLSTNWVRLRRWAGLRVLSAVVHRHLRRPHASPVHKPPRAGAHRVLAGPAGTCAPPRGTRRGDGRGSQHLHPSPRPHPAEVSGAPSTCTPPPGPPQRWVGAPRRGPLTSEYPRGCAVSSQPTSPRRSVPLKAMARCLPLWAIFSGFFSHFWLCTVIVTYLPTYVSSVLHVSIREVRCPRERGGQEGWLPAPCPAWLCTHPSTLEATLRGTLRTPGDGRGDGTRRGERTPRITGLLRDRALRSVPHLILLGGFVCFFVLFILFFSHTSFLILQVLSGIYTVPSPVCLSD